MLSAAFSSRSIRTSFKNFSASGNTQNYVPYQEYQNCEYKLKFLKKQLEFYLNNNKYTVAYNELDEFIRRYLRKFFPKDILLLAVNGEAGLDIFKENLDIKIVISDYEMPKMDGIEMIHEIKLLNPEVRALCITSKNMETLKHEFDVCMVKPITKEEFRVKMFDLLMKKYRTK